MSVWNWLSLLGIPAIVASIIVALWVRTMAISRGIQALLRDRLTQGYKFHEKEGWADIDDRRNLENIYVQYHNLGQNGVMDDLRDKFLALPTHPPKEEEKKND